MTIDITKVKSALVSAVLMAVLVIVGRIIEQGNIFAIDWQSLINAGVIAFLTGIVSLVKSLLTNDVGVFAGSVKIK